MGNTAIDSGGGLLTVGEVTADWLKLTGNKATAAQGGNGYGGGWVIDDTAPVQITVSNLQRRPEHHPAGRGDAWCGA